MKKGCILATKNPDSEWRDLADKRGFTKGRGPLRHRRLKNILLDIGGWAACIPAHEPDLAAIIGRGRRFGGESRTVKGERSRCHSNSSLLWEANMDKARICTGYALSSDGMWRQHSWVFFSELGLVETTEKRLQYFGYIMTLPECRAFLEDNL